MEICVDKIVRSYAGIEDAELECVERIGEMLKRDGIQANEYDSRMEVTRVKNGYRIVAKLNV